MARVTSSAYSTWSALFLLLLASVGLLALDQNTRWTGPLRATLSAVVTPVQWIGRLPVRASRALDDILRSDAEEAESYRRLREEYIKLKAELQGMQSLSNENRSLRELLQATERMPEKVEMAELLEVSLEPYRHQILINRGLTAGVYLGQPVIDARGVMGQVTDVTPLSSAVMLITDVEHAIPVQVQRSGLLTVAHGTGRPGELRLPYLTQNSDIKVDDLLVSSGLGGRFPNGYPVARVTRLDTVPGEQFLAASAAPIARVNQARHVLLLSPGEAPERDSDG